MGFGVSTFVYFFFPFFLVHSVLLPLPLQVNCGNLIFILCSLSIVVASHTRVHTRAPLLCHKVLLRLNRKLTIGYSSQLLLRRMQIVSHSWKWQLNVCGHCQETMACYSHPHNPNSCFGVTYVRLALRILSSALRWNKRSTFTCLVLVLQNFLQISITNFLLPVFTQITKKKRESILAWIIIIIILNWWRRPICITFIYFISHNNFVLGGIIFPNHVNISKYTFTK